MKVLIIRPPQTDFENIGPIRIGLPIGALSVAASIEQKGHDVRFFDSLIYNDKNDDKRHYGASWERIRKCISDFNPDIVGITNLSSVQLKNTLMLPKLVKQINPNIKVIVGGVHATVRPLDFLDSKYVDLVIIGEGEKSGQDMVDYYDGEKKLEDAKGVVYLKDGKLVTNPIEYIQDLDSLPIPGYHLVDMEKYFELAAKGYGPRQNEHFGRPKRQVSMITSRGCPYKCTFCSIHPTMGYKFRMQSPEYVVNHIKHLIDKYHVEFISFEDDNLTLDVKRFEAILALIEKEKLHFEWDTPNGVRADTLSRELLMKIKKSNVRNLRVAIESGVQDVLNNIVKKELDLDRVAQACRDCYELGIPLSAFYIIGFPGETKKDIEKTLDTAYNFMKMYNTFPVLGVWVPLVGTPLYNLAKQKGYLINEDYTSGFILGSSKVRTEEFDPEDLKMYTTNFYKRVRYLYILNMLKKPKILLKSIVNLITYPGNAINLLKISKKYTA